MRPSIPGQDAVDQGSDIALKHHRADAPKGPIMNTTAVLPDTTAEFAAPTDDTVRVPAQNAQGPRTGYEAAGDRSSAEPQANAGDNARAFAITSFVLGIASVV